MYCKKCGAPLREGDRFCPKCGAPCETTVGKQPEDPSEQPTQPVRPVQQPPRREAEPRRAAEPQRTARPSGGGRRTNYTPLIITLAAAAVLAVGILIAVLIVNGNKPAAPPTVTASPVPTESAAPTAAPTPEPTATPTPEPTPTPSQAPTAVPLSADEQGRVNRFLSYFSEQGFRDYDRGAGSDGQRIDFACLQIWRNDPEVVAADEAGQHFSADDVDDVSIRFFGVAPARQSTDLFTYADGAYTWAGADGAPDYMTVADTVTEQPDGTHLVEFTVYQVDGADAIPGDEALYRLTPAQAAERAGLSVSAKGSALLEDATYGGSASYHLNAYKLSGR